MANVYGNILMFMPIGVLLVWLWTSPLIARVIMATIAGAGLSLIIELTQLTLGRVADIDDVILNGSGALLGAMLAAGGGPDPSSREMGQATVARFGDRATRPGRRSARLAAGRRLHVALHQRGDCHVDGSRMISAA